MTEPIGGFANAAISTMFNPPPPSTSLPTATPHPKAKNNAYIAGIVIGTVAGIALVAGLIVYILRKRRKAKHPFEVHGESAQEAELHGESAQEKGEKSKCEQLPAELPPREMPRTELPENDCPVELP